jgi:hypothetical protein
LQSFFKLLRIGHFEQPTTTSASLTAAYMIDRQIHPTAAGGTFRQNLHTIFLQNRNYSRNQAFFKCNPAFAADMLYRQKNGRFIQPAICSSHTSLSCYFSGGLILPNQGIPWLGQNLHRAFSSSNIIAGSEIITNSLMAAEDCIEANSLPLMQSH